MKKSKVVTFRLSPETHAAAVKAAQTEGRKLGNWIQNLVRGKLARKEKKS